jgi:tyrosine-protein phosphatase non-receptor type 3
VETDYFSLCYKTKDGRVWINRRVRLKRQVKGQKPPYLLDFRVKYYVSPDSIIQMTTREMFYKQLKLDMEEGELSVPLSKAGWIGALLSQVEMGDCPHSLTPRLIYPQYFPVWEKGVPRRIALEHQKLRGMDKEDAEKLFVNEAAKLEKYGARSFPVKDSDDNDVTFYIGGRCVRIEYPSQDRIQQKIGYQYLMEASYDDNRFKIKYRMYTLREPTDYEVVFKTTRSKAAHLIFRTLTEDHTYFTQATVCDRVLNHFECETFYKVLKASVLNRPLEKKYHFDVVRTLSESFQYHWRKLHQMSGELREVVSVDGKEEEPEPSTSFDGDHSESGRSQTIGEDPVNHIERTVSPTPPTIEELEQSLSRPRRRLSRWRGRILHRGSADPSAHPVHSQPSDEQNAGLSPSTQSVLSRPALSLSDDASNPLTIENTLLATDDSTDKVIQSVSCHDGLKVEDNPTPLWMSFSPSVELFVTEILKDSSDNHPCTPTQTSSGSDSSVGACVSLAKDTKLGTTHKAKVDLHVSNKEVKNPTSLEATSDGQNCGIQESTEDSQPLVQKEHTSAKKKKRGKKNKSKKKQVLVAGLTEASLEIVKPVIERINDNFTCKVCMDRFVNTTFCPCGHYITCRQCAEMLVECPICRSPITHSMLVYQ